MCRWSTLVSSENADFYSVCPGRDPSFCVSNAAVHATSFEGQVSREPTQVLIAPHLTISSAQWTPIYYPVLESWWSEIAMREKKYQSSGAMYSICTRKQK